MKYFELHNATYRAENVSFIEERLSYGNKELCLFVQAGKDSGVVHLFDEDGMRNVIDYLNSDDNDVFIKVRGDIPTWVNKNHIISYGQSDRYKDSKMVITINYKDGAMTLPLMNEFRGKFFQIVNA